MLQIDKYLNTANLNMQRKKEIVIKVYPSYYDGVAANLNMNIRANKKKQIWVKKYVAWWRQQREGRLLVKAYLL